MNRRQSFEHMQSWVDRVRQLGGEHIEMLVVANKTDLHSSLRQITTVEGEALAATLAGGMKKFDHATIESERSVPYVETSAPMWRY